MDTDINQHIALYNDYLKFYIELLSNTYWYKKSFWKTQIPNFKEWKLMKINGMFQGNWIVISKIYPDELNKIYVKEHCFNSIFDDRYFDTYSINYHTFDYYMGCQVNISKPIQLK